MPPRPPAALGQSWAAVAISDAGAWGAAVEPQGERAAAPAALARCGADCRIAAQGAGRCVAVATSRSGGVWFGYAYGDELDKVRSIAMKGCADRAPAGCRMAHFSCLASH